MKRHELAVCPTDQQQFRPGTARPFTGLKPDQGRHVVLHRVVVCVRPNLFTLVGKSQHFRSFNTRPEPGGADINAALVNHGGGCEVAWSHVLLPSKVPRCCR